MKSQIKHYNPMKQGKFSQTNYQSPSPIQSRPRSMESNNNKSGYLQQTKSSQNRKQIVNQPNLKQRQFINKKNVFSNDHNQSNSNQYSSTQQYYSSNESNPKQQQYISNPKQQQYISNPKQQQYISNPKNNNNEYQQVSCSQNISNIQQLQKTNKTDVDLDQIEYETQIFDKLITQKDYQRLIEDKDKEIQELNRRNSQLEKQNQQLKDNVYKERINYEQQLMKINKNIQGLKTMQQDYQDIKYQINVKEQTIKQKDQTIKQKDQTIQSLEQKVRQLQGEVEYSQNKKVVNEQEYFSFNQQMYNPEEQQAFQYTLDNQSQQEEEEEEEEENKQSIFNAQPIKHSIFDITKNEDKKEKKEVHIQSEQIKTKQEKENKTVVDIKPRQDLNINDDKENRPQNVNQKDKYAYVVYDFISQRENDISLKKGQKVKILQMKDNGWWIGICDSKIGFFPYNYVELV